MKKYLGFFRELYFKIINSIAFYPSLIASVFLAFAIAMMWAEYTKPLMDLKDKIDFLLVADKETAKSVLTTLVASLISLTVFSFSMVMVVLNTASANLSPRVLPGLVSKKAHQVVLGFYLGSIIYCLVLIINVQKNEETYRTPTLGVLLAMIFGIMCLALFVYFIESISRTIQTDNVLNQIFKQTLKHLEKWKSSNQNDDTSLPERKEWTYIYSNTNGYYKSMAKNRLSKLLQKHDLQLYVRVTKGTFTVKGFPLLSVSRDISNDEELIEEILSHFTFYVEEYTTDHYSYGFRQISQVAIKALSPGINDPGTAIRAIDMLSILFIEKTNIPDFGFYHNEEENITNIFYKEYSFEDLLYEMLAPIRTYGHSDALVMLNLIEACKNMMYADKLNENCKHVIGAFVKAIIQDAEEYISNASDKEQINQSLQNLVEDTGLEVPSSI
ncbi:DUF2254 domain-containing protein [Owenweeksia hongkongensis]|uniref:DUF2254 domain-containing protein n=1 Tax=Owenweeksia hongkongensis TaxID=253245 RepID=UPI003A93FBAD